MRATVLRMKDDIYRIIINLHHIVTDEWSMEVLLREWKEVYDWLSEGGEGGGSPLRIQYKDYAVWERDQLSGILLEESRRFWVEQFAGQEPVAELPADRRRPVTAEFAGGTIGYWLPGDVQEGLRRLAAEQGASLYMTLLSLIGILLYKYTGQPRVVTGTPTLGRGHADLEGQMGFYVNTLAVVSEIKSEEAFVSLLERTKQQVLNCYAHERYPFDRLVSELDIPREANRNPLFDVMINYHHGGSGGQQRNRRADLFVFSGEDGTASKFDCTVTILDTTEELQLQLNYRTSLFDRSRMERMMGHLERLAEQVIADPLVRVQELTLLSGQEQQQVLLEWNGPKSGDGQAGSVVDLFAEQVQRDPGAVAAVYEGQRLTYGELDERSDQLADQLESLGVGSEELVGIFMRRGLEVIIGMLGILKAGGAYVPVDAGYPLERVRYMLEDAGVRVVLTDAERRDRVAEMLDGRGVHVVELKEERAKTGGRYKRGPKGKPLAGQLAYVAYTSGSTGRPKGVMTEQGGLVNMVRWNQERYGVSSSSRALSIASISFDAFGWELWPYLLKGASVYLVGEEQRGDLSVWLDLCEREGLTHCFVPTALAGAFIGGASGRRLKLEYVQVAGEKLGPLEVGVLSYEVVNNYGPTENTVVATSYGLSQADGGRVPPIGRAVANTRIYVVDRDGGLSPEGVPGELWIGGAQVTRGYWNRPELTAEKFVADPFVPGGRVYKTGDVGRWMADGNIEYLGRIDEQVKVRGYRIEPGEIEGVVSQSGMVQQVAVAVWQERLVGYVIAEEFDQAKLAAYLGSRLPEYMVPQLWVELDALPLTASGKIDKQRLPEPQLSEARRGYIAPVTEMQKLLAGIWEKILAVEKIGLDDNFFTLGGNSIKVVKAFVALQNVDQNFKLTDLYNYPTIRRLTEKEPGEVTGQNQTPEVEEFEL